MGQLTNPLQSIVGKAASTLPANTGAVAAYAARAARIGSAPTVILADVSGSMAEPAHGGQSKHAALREALMQTATGRVLAFASAVRECGPADLPPPGGGTALHRALTAAIALSPGLILVISDGEPDDAGAALLAASHFPGVIDTLYIGPDSNADAKAFLRALASAGHGRYHGSDISRAGQPTLALTMRTLLLGVR